MSHNETIAYKNLCYKSKVRTHDPSNMLLEEKYKWMNNSRKE